MSKTKKILSRISLAVIILFALLFFSKVDNTYAGSNILINSIYITDFEEPVAGNKPDTEFSTSWYRYVENSHNYEGALENAVVFDGFYETSDGITWTKMESSATYKTNCMYKMCFNAQSGYELHEDYSTTAYFGNSRSGKHVSCRNKNHGFFIMDYQNIEIDKTTEFKIEKLANRSFYDENRYCKKGFKFIPSADGDYTIRVSGGKYENIVYIEGKDFSVAPTGENITAQYSLKKGETYYFMVQHAQASPDKLTEDQNLSITISRPIVDATGKYNYFTEGDKAIILKYLGSDLTINIPSKLDGNTVTEIGQGAFARLNLVSVNIPSSVVSLGDMAFYGDSDLKNIMGGTGIKEIGVYAFNSCTSLVEFPEFPSLENMSYDAIWGCLELKTVYLGKNVKDISGLHFISSFCIEKIIVNKDNPVYYSDKGILFKRGTTGNGDELVYYPAGKETSGYQTPANISSIGAYAFAYNEHIKYLLITSNVTYIKGNAISIKTNIDNMTVLGNPDYDINSKSDFSYSSYTSAHIKEIHAPSGSEILKLKNTSNVDGIIDNYQALCSGLCRNESEKTLETPSFSHIFSKAYVCSDCWGLTRIESYGPYDFKLKDDIYEYPFTGGEVKPVVVIDGLTENTDYRLEYSSNRSVGTAKVNVVGMGIFNGVAPYTINYEIYDPAKVISYTATGYEGFYDGKDHSLLVTSSTSGVTIEYSLDGKRYSEAKPLFSDIGEYTVYYKLSCKGSKTVYGNVKIIIKNKASEVKEFTVGDFTYKVNSDNTSVTVSAYKGNAKTVTISKTISYQGKEYNISALGDKLLYKNKKITKLTIGNNVQTIGKSAFASCTKLKTVKLGSAVTSVSSSAFSGCKSLTSLTLNSKLQTIGKKAFYGCSGLTKVTIPSKVTKIGDSAFEKCSKLKNVTIKTTKLTSKNVGAKAFKSLSKSVKVKVPKKQKAKYIKFLVKKGLKKNQIK